MLIIIAYWPPMTTKFNDNDIELVTSFATSFVPTHTVILMGDLNMSRIKWTTSYEESPYLIPDMSNARPHERDAIALIHGADLI